MYLDAIFDGFTFETIVEAVEQNEEDKDDSLLLRQLGDKVFDLAGLISAQI